MDIPNTSKIMITGGYNDDYLDSTEILDTEGGKVTRASPMNSKRSSHGMGVVTINEKDRLAVFGGDDGRTLHDSVELYNTETEKWELTDFKLSEPKSRFSFLTVKLGDILSNLKPEGTIEVIDLCTSPILQARKLEQDPLVLETPETAPQPTPGVANPPLQPQIKEADSSFRREWQVIDLDVTPETIVLMD